MTLEEIANKNKEIMEDNKLLLVDLCSRLPCRTMVLIKDGGIEPLLNVNVDTFICNGQRDLPKPYLRPMSSMTEEERKIYMEIGSHLCGEIAAKTMIDWLNANHFDYRGLIEKGLALEAPEGMYKTEWIMKKPDFEKEAVAFCFDNGINVTPHQAGMIAKHFYELGFKRIGDGRA